MIITQETKCPECSAEFMVEFDIEEHPEGLKVCPFCEELLLPNADVAELHFED